MLPAGVAVGNGSRMVMRGLGGRRPGRPRRRFRADLVQLLVALPGLVLGLLLARVTAAHPVGRAAVSGGRGGRPGGARPPGRRGVAWRDGPAVLQQLDLRRVVGAAGGAVIVLRARIGDTLQEGAVVAGLHGGDASNAAVLGGLVTG